MTFEAFRDWWNQRWRTLHDAAVARKEPNLALTQMSEIYESLDQSQRLLADRVLGEWLSSDDVALRAVAMAHADQFDIKGLTPALESLVIRLQVQAGPEASFERETALEILAGLRVI